MRFQLPSGRQSGGDIKITGPKSLRFVEVEPEQRFPHTVAAAVTIRRKPKGDSRWSFAGHSYTHCTEMQQFESVQAIFSRLAASYSS
jgi:hypothetical protein